MIIFLDESGDLGFDLSKKEKSGSWCAEFSKFMANRWKGALKARVRNYPLAAILVCKCQSGQFFRYRFVVDREEKEKGRFPFFFQVPDLWKVMS